VLLEDLLARHPRFVYVDVSGLIWSYPIKEVNMYIQRIVDAGFEDRVMFGTDQMYWPKLMATSIA
jgi:predicted TIM-barrel fold metal-dependent hydrolase